MRVKGDARATSLEFGQYSPPISVSLFPLPSAGSGTELETRVEQKVMS